jgi:hypothetical protein
MGKKGQMAGAQPGGIILVNDITGCPFRFDGNVLRKGFCDQMMIQGKIDFPVLNLFKGGDQHLLLMVADTGKGSGIAVYGLPDDIVHHPFIEELPVSHPPEFCILSRMIQGKTDDPVFGFPGTDGSLHLPPGLASHHFKNHIISHEIEEKDANEAICQDLLQRITKIYFFCMYPEYRECPFPLC